MILIILVSIFAHLFSFKFNLLIRNNNHSLIFSYLLFYLQQKGYKNNVEMRNNNFLFFLNILRIFMQYLPTNQLSGFLASFEQVLHPSCPTISKLVIAYYLSVLYRMRLNCTNNGKKLYAVTSYIFQRVRDYHIFMLKFSI